jgi:hypothetical protein
MTITCLIFFKSSWSQPDLNKLFEGGAFDITKRYAASLVTVFVCMALAPGMPLLYPIAAATFALGYAGAFVPKYLSARERGSQRRSEDRRGHCPRVSIVMPSRNDVISRCSITAVCCVGAGVIATRVHTEGEGGGA